MLNPDEDLNSWQYLSKQKYRQQQIAKLRDIKLITEDLPSVRSEEEYLTKIGNNEAYMVSNFQSKLTLFSTTIKEIMSNIFPKEMPQIISFYLKELDNLLLFLHDYLDHFYENYSKRFAYYIQLLEKIAINNSFHTLILTKLDDYIKTGCFDDVAPESLQKEKLPQESEAKKEIGPKPLNIFASQELAQTPRMSFMVRDGKFPDEVVCNILTFMNKSDILNFTLTCKNWNSFFKCNRNNIQLMHLVDLKKFYSQAKINVIKQFIRQDLSIAKQLKSIFIHINKNPQKRQIFDYIYDTLKNENYPGNELNPNLFPWAIACNKVDVVGNFINSGIDINHFDPFWGQPLTVASAYGYTDLVKLLLAQSQILVATPQGTRSFKISPYTKLATPLQFAAFYGHNEIIAALKERGADVNYWDVITNTALYYAVLNDKFETVKLLVSLGASCDVVPLKQHPFTFVAKKGKLEMLQLLVKIFPNAIHLFCEVKDYHSDLTPLVVALLNRKYHIVEYFESVGVDLKKEVNVSNSPGYFGTSLQYYAIAAADQHVVDWLSNKGVGIEVVTESPEACMRLFTDHALRSNRKGINYLVDLNLNINSQDKFGSTALHLIIENGIKAIQGEIWTTFEIQVRRFAKSPDAFLSALQLLLDFGANPYIVRGKNKKDDAKKYPNISAFQVALIKKSLPMLEVLLNCSSKLICTQSEFSTLLECFKHNPKYTAKITARKEILKAENLLLRNKDSRDHHIQTNWYECLQYAQQQDPIYFEQYLNQILNGKYNDIYTAKKLAKLVNLDVVMATSNVASLMLIVSIKESFGEDRHKIEDMLLKARKRFTNQKNDEAVQMIDDALAKYQTASFTKRL